MRRVMRITGEDLGRWVASAPMLLALSILLGAPLALGLFVWAVPWLARLALLALCMAALAAAAVWLASPTP